ncbi:hypothetical protein U9M48_038237 [Paspalum notatum var. saurae]|uniref:Uncharacterized protein n=1 Tax=Paspalum notatum var. saurae TaxID=547442 RepID=A0AAQ3UKY0_PASNO
MAATAGAEVGGIATDGTATVVQPLADPLQDSNSRKLCSTRACSPMATAEPAEAGGAATVRVVQRRILSNSLLVLGWCS